MLDQDPPPLSTLCTLLILIAVIPVLLLKAIWVVFRLAAVFTVVLAVTFILAHASLFL